MHPHEFLRHYPHEFMIQQAYEDMELASRKPTFGQGSSPKQNIIENAMAMLQFPEFKMFSKKDYVRFVWNEGHKNQDLLYISPRKGIDRRMKKVIKTWGKVLRNPLKRNGVLQQWKNNPIMPRNYLAALNKGWSGPPWWTISPTISAHHLTGNPPDDDEGESYEFEVDVDLDEEDAKQLAYDMAADSEFRETMQAVATEGEKTFYLMVKKVEAGYQFIISPDKDPNADLIDVVEPAIVKFRDDWRRSLENPTFKVIIGDIITVSGPSSSGKSAISKTLSKKLRARMVPSYMSRERRPSEVEGVDGIFISKEKFQDLIDNGAFTTKDGVELWVKQKSGEYYGRKVSDFMQSTTAIVDVNFEGLRLMRKAFPGRTYSVFIRTNMGPKRRRENLEKRGVHSEEEIEARVRAGTGMLETFQNLNFDFIARNKYGELDKNVAMIAAEFKKAKKNPPAKTTAVYIGPANHLSVAEVIDAEHFVLIDSGPNQNYAGGPEETDEGKNWFMEQLYDMAGALNFTIVHQERKLNKDGAAVIRFTTPKGRTIDYYYNTVHPFAKGQDIPAIREALLRADSLIIAGFLPHKAILDEMPNLETIFLYDRSNWPSTIQEATSERKRNTLIESLFHRSDLTYTVMSRDEDPDAYYGKAPITDQFIELGSKGSFGSYSEAASAAQAADAAWKISDGPSNNPPAEDVQWTVNVTTQLPKATDWLFGHSVPAAKAEYISAWILLTGKNADGEVKMILSVMEDLDRVVNKLLPSLFRHKTETEKMGLTSFAMVEQIETKSRGKGLGQAAYLKAAEYTMNEFGAPLITGNHSLSAEKAWRGVERNLPEGYKVVKWIGGEYPEWEALEVDLEDAFNYHRVLWYGPRIAKRKKRKYSNKVCPHPEKNAYRTKQSAEQNIPYDKRHLVRAYKCPIDGKAHWHLTSSINDNPSAKGINLRTIIEAWAGERGPRFLKSMIDQYSHALTKPRRPKKRTLESSLKMRWAQGLSAEEIEERILQRYRNDIKHYRNKLRNWKRGQEKRIKYYGYSGTSGKKLLSIVLDTIEKEFKGRATITAYRAIFAFNSGKKDIVDWLKMHGTGDYYSTWKRGADIYFPEFSKGQNWLQIPGAVAWLITAEISILDINWNRTLRNRLNYPEEKELSIGLSPADSKLRKINRLIKRVDVYDLNQAAKYSTSDSTGQGKQPWLSTKVKPIASYEFKGLKANSPSQDAIHQETLEKTGFWGAQGAGCIVMAKSTGRFLLPLRSQQVEQPGTWGVWGGAIDSDEIPMEAAKRELTEEAGYGGDISMKPLVMYSSGSFRYHNFLAVVDEEFEPTLDWETEKAGWFELKDFPEPLHFGLIYLLANSMKQIVEAQSQEEVAEVPRFLYHGSPVAGLKIIEARLDPVFAKKWKESNKGEPPKTVFLTENPSEAEWYALGGYQSMKHSYTDGSDKSFRDKIAQKTMDQPTPGVIYRIKTEGIDGLVPLGHNAWVVFNQDVSVHDYKSIKEYTEAGIEWARSNPPVFDGEGAMNMGFQHEGTSRYHGHPLPGGSEIPAISGKWKKKSFPSGSEMPLSSKQESDGTYTMGFLERFEDDDRPYIVSNKIDGDSSIAHFDGKETVLWNKRGRWRKDYHLTEQITASLQKNGVKSAIILGELYAVDEKGDILPFKEQTRHITAPKDIETQNRARFAAYDMAQLNGKDIQDEPYASRMELLKPLIKGSAVKVVQFWRSRGGMGDILLAWDEVSKNPHFEGLVVRFDGDKKSFKVKMTGTADLAVIGFYRGREGGRDEGTIGGGTLAWMDEDGNYVVAGNSVIGESLVKKDELLKRLLPTAIDAPKVKWGDHLVDRSITHDHRGKGTITAIEPFLIGEFKYRSINYSEKPVYRLENDRFIQVGTKRAPTLQQATFGRWRPDKELTPHDLRMGQVAEEGQGKWLKNPHKKDSQYAWWEPDEKGHRIFNNSNSLQFIREQLVGNRNISRREVFDMVAYGIEEKYGVQYQTVSEEEARKIPYLRAKQSFYGPYVHGKSNYGTWDEDNGIVYFNKNMFNDRSTALMELGHETGAVIIASKYGVNKKTIPRVDGTAMNQKMRLTHLVDKYTFGELEPAPGAARKLVLSNPPAMGLEWEHRVEEIKGREHQTLFGRDETGGGVAVRWNMELLAGGNRRARIESIGLRDQASMAIDSGVFNGKRLTEKEMRALEDLDGLTPASMKGKGYGQAAYLKILDYADEVYSFRPSAKATRAWDALEKRQKELGITIEKIPKKYVKGFTRLLKRVKANPPEEEEEDETEYPGGTSQYLMDGIIIGSLKHRQGGPYLGWPGGPNIQRIGWQIQYPELEARLEEAKKRGWTGEGMALPKMGTDIWEKSWAKNPPRKPSVDFSKSPKPDKKMVAVFTYNDGRTKTTHFGAQGMSDYTIHKDPKRKKRYLNRHRKNENWDDYTSAGSLSRYILWGEPTLKASISSYLKRFGLKAVMNNPATIKSSNRVNIHIPKIISMKWYTEATLKSNRDKLFLFGDNEARKGKGGQAEYCRGKPNAMGIRTKKSPSLKDGAFWTDKNYQENIKMMADDFMAVFDAGYETIVLPTAGIGTGLAQLKDRAPKTYRWLSSMMKQLSALEE